MIVLRNIDALFSLSPGFYAGVQAREGACLAALSWRGRVLPAWCAWRSVACWVVRQMSAERRRHEHCLAGQTGRVGFVVDSCSHAAQPPTVPRGGRRRRNETAARSSHCTSAATSTQARHSLRVWRSSTGKGRAEGANSLRMAWRAMWPRLLPAALTSLNPEQIILHHPALLAGFFVTAPSAAELTRFGALLGAGAVPIGGYAEQDFLNAVYKARSRGDATGRGVLFVCSAGVNRPLQACRPWCPTCSSIRCPAMAHGVTRDPAGDLADAAPHLELPKGHPAPPPAAVEGAACGSSRRPCSACSGVCRHTVRLPGEDGSPQRLNNSTKGITPGLHRLVSFPCGWARTSGAAPERQTAPSDKQHRPCLVTLSGYVWPTQELWGDVAVLHYTDAKPWQPGHPGKCCWSVDRHL